jgi:type IV pilus assembly protein PilA
MKMNEKKMNMKKKNNKGFTLVELIIVMAIMAILIGAIVPQVLAYVNHARESKDLQLCNTVFTAVQTGLSSEENPSNFTQADLSTVMSSCSKIATLLGDDLDTSSEIIAKTESNRVVRSGTTGVWNVYVDYNSSTGHLEVYFAAAKNAAAGDRIRVSN